MSCENSSSQVSWSVARSTSPLSGEPGFQPVDRRASTRPSPLNALVSVASMRCGLKSAARLRRSEENTSELQSLKRISYAVYCFKKNTSTEKISFMQVQYYYTIRSD